MARSGCRESLRHPGSTAGAASTAARALGGAEPQAGNFKLRAGKALASVKPVAASLAVEGDGPKAQEFQLVVAYLKEIQQIYFLSFQ